MNRGNPALYFAFGSNLHAPRLRRRCPSAALIGAATLEGYALRFARRSGLSLRSAVADIVPDETAKVVGAVWAISERDLDALDLYEGHPHVYRRTSVRVRCAAPRGDVDLLTWTYRLPRSAPEGMPAESYYSIIADGYDALALDRGLLRGALQDSIEADDPLVRHRRSRRKVHVRDAKGRVRFDHLLDDGGQLLMFDTPGGFVDKYESERRGETVCGGWHGLPEVV